MDDRQRPLADAEDEEQVMTARSSEDQQMIEEANEIVGSVLRQMLDGLPADQQINHLIKLASALACTSVAQHRINTGDKREEFYVQALRVAGGILVDITTDGREQ